MEATTSESGKHSSDRLWATVTKYARVAGREVVEKALTLWFAMQDPSVPKWAKRICAGALAYFIFPVDAIPDLLGPVGYTDDLGVIAAALAAIALHLTPETRQRAQDKAREWFGE